eukprot:scaffold61898_cov72-Phaeocystis_antarctica.AAC.2
MVRRRRPCQHQASLDGLDDQHEGIAGALMLQLDRFATLEGWRRHQRRYGVCARETGVSGRANTTPSKTCWGAHQRTTR